jgi:hypothetical protein
LLDQVSIGEKKISFPYNYNSHKKRIINEYYAYIYHHQCAPTMKIFFINKMEILASFILKILFLG